MGQNLSRVMHIKRELVFQWNFNTARVILVPATIKTLQRGRLKRKGYCTNDNRKVYLTSTSCVTALQAFPLVTYLYQNLFIYIFI